MGLELRTQAEWKQAGLGICIRWHKGDGKVTFTERRFCQVHGHRAQEPEAERLCGLEAGTGRAGVEVTGRGKGAGLTVPLLCPHR